MSLAFIAYWLAAQIQVGGLGCRQLPHAAKDERHLESIVAQAQATWNRYLAASQAVQGRRIMTGTVNGDPWGYREILIVKKNDACTLAQLTHEILSPSSPATLELHDTVVGKNSRYTFRLRRKPTDASWALTSHANEGREASSLPNFAETALTLGPRVALQPIPVLLADKSVRLVSFARHGSARQANEYELTFEVQQPYGTIWAQAILDADRYWLVARGSFEIRNRESKPMVTGTTTSTFTNDLDLPLLKERLTVYTESFPGRSALHYSVKEIFDRTVPKQLPRNDEFTLSAFGLPEPFGVTWERPTPWWLYAGIAAAALFVLALLIGVVIRRLQARRACMHP